MKSWHLPPALHFAVVCLIMLVITRVYASYFANVETFPQAARLTNGLRGASLGLALLQLHLNVDTRLRQARHFTPGYAAILLLDLASGPVLTGKLDLNSMLLSLNITILAALTLSIRARQSWRRFAASLSGLEQIER